MNLYEINSAIEDAINNLLTSVDEETGEVNPEALQNLSDLQVQKDEKLDNIGAYIKNLLAEADMIKAEEANLKARREAKEKKAERLKDYLSTALNGEKFESPRVSCTWRKSEVVTIPDLEAIPDEYKKTKTEISADKTAIKKAIKAGQEVKGATLETKNNLQIK